MNGATFIVSDLHLGAPQCRLADWHAFIDALPADAALVLNGDTIERGIALASAPSGHGQALRRLSAESQRRSIICLRGNNDPEPELLIEGRIEFRDSLVVGAGVHVEHGHRFDRIRPPFRPLLYAIKRAYDSLSGGRALHITELAARFPIVLRMLTHHMARNAAAFARSQGITTVVCGHSHDAADRIVNGVRYINTGCWTGTGAYTAIVTDRDIRLERCGCDT